MMRKFLALVLSVILIVGCIPLTAGAAGITYSFNEQTGTLVISGTGPMEEKDEFCYDWSDLHAKVTTIKIKNGVTSIAYGAFYGFSKLQRVDIAGSVKVIGVGAFSVTPLRSVTIPEGVEEIKDAAFAMCIGLEEITLPSTLKKVESCAFMDCLSLEKVVIAATDADIEEYAIGFNSLAKKDSLSVDKFFDDFGAAVDISMEYSQRQLEYSEYNAAYHAGEIGEEEYYEFQNAFIEFETQYEATIESLRRYLRENTEELTGIVIPEELTIYGYEGSTAEKYASDMGISFELITRTGSKISQFFTKIIDFFKNIIDWFKSLLAR